MTADHRSAFFFWGLHELGSADEMVQGHMFGEYSLLGSGARSPWKLPGTGPPEVYCMSADL